MSEVQSDDIVATGSGELPLRRFAMFLVALHAIAFVLDRLISMGGQPFYRQEFGLTFLLQVIYCDAAMLCVWGMRERAFPGKLVGVCAIPSLLLASILLWCWVDWNSTVFHFARLISETFSGQCLLLTVMLLPLMIALTWLAVHGSRQDRLWYLLALMLVLAIGGCYLSSTAYDYIAMRSRGWWLEHGWICFFQVVLAATLSFAAVMLCAWVFDHWRRGRRFGIAALVIAICAVFIGVASFLEIATNQSFYYTWTRGSFRLVWDTTWQLLYRQGMPVLAATLMLGICALLSLVGVKRSATSPENEREPLESPFAETQLNEEAWRYRLWKLAGFALAISSLNLLAGMYAWLARIDRSAFGELGLVFELLFLAPLGLWSAQMAASAIFLECKIWNFWKRLLIVLAWAELTILAYWGQVALSNSIRWRPSDYVGEVLHVSIGAVVLALIGGLIGKWAGVRVIWKPMESSTTKGSEKRRLAISLSDIICIVTVSAGLAYPFSVIFSLENWVTPSSLFREMLYSSVWPVVTGAAGYFALRAWLGTGNKAFACLVASAFCLMSSCAADYPTLTQVGDETFFGVRYSLRTMALPWLFVGTAIAGIGLQRVGFGVVRNVVPVGLKHVTVDEGLLAPEKRFAPAVVRDASPWD